jgi:hypothetical protein
MKCIKVLEKDLLKNKSINWMWWHTPIIPALGRMKQKDGQFKANLGYMVTLYLQKQQ